MPKAPSFFHHFDWTAIGDREIIVLTLCRELVPWLPIAGDEGKHVSGPR
jgi:hypothetical protein